MIMDLSAFQSFCGAISQPVLLLQRAPHGQRQEDVASTTAAKDFHFDLLPFVEPNPVAGEPISDDGPAFTQDVLSRNLPRSAFDTDIHCLFMNTPAMALLHLVDKNPSLWQMPYRQSLASLPDAINRSDVDVMPRFERQ